MTYNYNTSTTKQFQCKPIPKYKAEKKEPKASKQDETGTSNGKNTLTALTPQQCMNYYYKKKPAPYYLWSKTYRVRHKPLRLDRFPDSELRKIRCGAFVGHQDHRCDYCPFHGIKHGHTLHPTLNCICRFKSVAPSPLKHDITKYMVTKTEPLFNYKHVYFNTGNRQIDRIISHMCMNNANKKN